MGKAKKESGLGAVVKTAEAFHAARAARASGGAPRELPNVISFEPAPAEEGESPPPPPPPSKPKPRRDRAPAPAPAPERLDSKTYQLPPRMHQALTRVAVDRMMERGRGQPDASEVLREVLEGWLAEQ